MAIRLRGKTATTGGQVYTVLVMDATYVGTVQDIELRNPGFVLTYAGAEDIWAPIVPSTIEIPWLVTSAAQETFISELALAEEGRIRVVIRKGNLDTSPIWWAGIVTTDNLIVQDAPQPYDSTITAVDGLQLLSRRDYTPGATGEDYIGHVIDLLKLVDTSDLFDNGAGAVTFVRGTTDVAPDVATFGDAFTEVKLAGEFFDPATGLYNAFPYNAEEYLSNLLRCYNSRIFLTDGAFTIQPLGTFINGATATVTFRRFLADKTEESGELTTVLVYTGAAQANHKIKGWRIQYMPPVRQVLRPLIYGNGLIVTNIPGPGADIYPEGASTGDTSATFTVPDSRTYPAGATFALTGRASIQCSGNSAAFPYTGKLRIGVTVKVGGYYLRRMGVELETTAGSGTAIPAAEFENASAAVTVYDWGTPEEAEWTTTNTDKLQIGSELINYDAPIVYIGNQPQYEEEIPLNFTTPQLPADTTGTIEITFICTLLEGDGTAASSGLKDITPLWIDFQLAANGNSNTADFIAVNTNSASETRIEKPVYFGSQLVESGEYIYNPSEFYNINGPLNLWNSALTTTAGNVHAICTSDIAKYYEQSREIYSGDLINSQFIPFYCQVYDSDRSKFFLQASATYYADQETTGLELHEADKGAGTPTGDVVLVGNGYKPPGSTVDVSPVKTTVRRFIRLANSNISDVQTDVANINRTTDASGGLSDVHLEYLGDVKISGPTDGQILEYSSAAGRWGNVTSGGGGGGVTAVSGTAPVVSSGGTTPDISITASTTGAAGSMSATDKTKIDGIETGAQVNVNADWNAASGDAEILNKPGQFPSNQVVWIGTGTSSAGANVYSLSVTENYIPWSTRLKNLYNVAVDTGSDANADKEYVIPADGLYEMNIFMVVINTAGSDGTLCKLIAAVGTNGTAQQLCARTTKTISAGQYDGTGGTVVFQGTAGDKITPALYFRRNGTGGTFKLSYFNDYLHAAIRRIN